MSPIVLAATLTGPVAVFTFALGAEVHRNICSEHYTVNCISNNNNNYDSVYDAVIMTKVIARVHSVHLMNAD